MKNVLIVSLICFVFSAVSFFIGAVATSMMISDSIHKDKAECQVAVDKYDSWNGSCDPITTYMSEPDLIIGFKPK